jgi:hypothetical protein
VQALFGVLVGVLISITDVVSRRDGDRLLRQFFLGMFLLGVGMVGAIMFAYGTLQQQGAEVNDVTTTTTTTLAPSTATPNVCVQPPIANDDRQLAKILVTTIPAGFSGLIAGWMVQGVMARRGARRKPQITQASHIIPVRGDALREVAGQMVSSPQSSKVEFSQDAVAWIDRRTKSTTVLDWQDIGFFVTAPMLRRGASYVVSYRPRPFGWGRLDSSALANVEYLLVRTRSNSSRHRKGENFDLLLVENGSVEAWDPIYLRFRRPASSDQGFIGQWKVVATLHRI